jgi:excisionase family DNA binding protein
MRVSSFPDPRAFSWVKKISGKGLTKMDNGKSNLPKLLKPAELSDQLGVPKPTIYSWVRRGDIPFVKLGGLVRFDPEEINTWIGERKHPARKKLLFLREASSQG